MPELDLKKNIPLSVKLPYKAERDKKIIESIAMTLFCFGLSVFGFFSGLGVFSLLPFIPLCVFTIPVIVFVSDRLETMSPHKKFPLGVFGDLTVYTSGDIKKVDHPEGDTLTLRAWCVRKFGGNFGEFVSDYINVADSEFQDDEKFKDLIGDLKRFGYIREKEVKEESKEQENQEPKKKGRPKKDQVTETPKVKFADLKYNGYAMKTQEGKYALLITFGKFMLEDITPKAENGKSRVFVLGNLYQYLGKEYDKVIDGYKFENPLYVLIGVQKKLIGGTDVEEEVKAIAKASILVDKTASKLLEDKRYAEINEEEWREKYERSDNTLTHIQDKRVADGDDETADDEDTIKNMRDRVAYYKWVKEQEEKRRKTKGGSRLHNIWLKLKKYKAWVIGVILFIVFALFIVWVLGQFGIHI